MQLFRDAEVREANQGDEACFGRLKRTCAAELENFRRVQSDRAVTRSAETEGAVTRAAETEISSSDENGDEYFKVATEFAAKREAAKTRAAAKRRAARGAEALRAATPGCCDCDGACG